MAFDILLGILFDTMHSISSILPDFLLPILHHTFWHYICILFEISIDNILTFYLTYYLTFYFEYFLNLYVPFFGVVSDVYLDIFFGSLCGIFLASP
jgi:hypothetical protein